jgi:hypothetical protein
MIEELLNPEMTGKAVKRLLDETNLELQLLAAKDKGARERAGIR